MQRGSEVAPMKAEASWLERPKAAKARQEVGTGGSLEPVLWRGAGLWGGLESVEEQLSIGIPRINA